MQRIHTRRSRPIQIRLLGIHIALQSRINSPFHNLKGGVESRGETVADGVVEVVPEDEVVAVDGGFGGEAEGDAVLVFVLVVGW